MRIPRPIRHCIRTARDLRSIYLPTIKAAASDGKPALKECTDHFAGLAAEDHYSLAYCFPTTLALSGRNRPVTLSAGL
jgi:hypothetical protein